MSKRGEYLEVHHIAHNYDDEITGTNENAQQAANRYCRPSVDYFERIRFPRKGPLLPDGKQTFGKSSLARDGWQ